ncbi:hypothetical protein C8R45DRAFT_1008572 [Mycena sanguinolenta]|nr:hypothetical protein C8R45DRAFT_1008572 [Mycena sanguinolenta]
MEVRHRTSNLHATRASRFLNHIFAVVLGMYAAPLTATPLLRDSQNSPSHPVGDEKHLDFRCGKRICGRSNMNMRCNPRISS